MWQQNQAKTKRLRGEQYENRSGIEVPSRKVGMPCRSDYCKNSSKRNCECVTAEDMQYLFDSFWSMSSWDERQTYIKAHVEKYETKQHTVSSNSGRKNSFNFFVTLPSNSARVGVCKSMFCATFGVSPRTVGDWLSSSGNKKHHLSDFAPKSGPKKPISEQEKTFLCNIFVNSCNSFLWLIRIITAEVLSLTKTKNFFTLEQNCKIFMTNTLKSRNRRK